MLSIGACGKAKEDEFAVTQQESSPQVVENIDKGMTSKETIRFIYQWFNRCSGFQRYDFKV